MDIEAIVTIPPYAPYLSKVAKHPLVSGLRLNTVMPVAETLDDLLSRMKEDAHGKDIWIDLKTRQIRVTNYASTPYEHLEISHNISVDTPTQAFFSDGDECATLAKVDGNKLIMLDGPKRVVGPGESINILDPSLKIDGFLTDTDIKYIDAAKRNGIHTYMVSFVENEKDIDEILRRDPDAQILAKIESEKGLEFAKHFKDRYNGAVHLMAARGDLYVEAGYPRPHRILNATKSIVRKDPEAVVASRLFPSFQDGARPSCQDISDVGYLLEIGYKSFMIGDDICFEEKSVLRALGLLQAIAHDYGPTVGTYADTPVDKKKGGGLWNRLLSR